MENHLNDLIGQSEQSGLVGLLPLLQIDVPVSLAGSGLRCGRLELDVVEIGLEVLEEDHFLPQVFWVFAESEVAHKGIETLLVLGDLPFDVDEVEVVFVQNHLGGVIEEDRVTVV